MSKIIIVGNLKGGVGKSTVTSLIANYIHFKTDYRVAVIDADDSQRSISHLREMDLENGYKEDDLYDLLKIKSKNYLKSIASLYEYYDFILIDLPGNLIQEGVMDIYKTADMILIPMPAEKMVVDATVQFILTIRNEINPLREKINTKPIDVKVFLNKVNKRRLEVKEIFNHKNQYGFDILDEYLPDYTLFSRYTTTASVYEHDNNIVNRFTKKIMNLIEK